MKISNLPSGPLDVNTYLVIDEKSKKGFVVDPGGYNPELKKQVEKDGIEIEYIILTHGHGDHIGGVHKHLEDFSNAKVVAHESEKEMLEDDSMNMSAALGIPISITPDLMVKDGDTLQIGTMKLKFLHTPGHSQGGMCISVGDVVFSGDTLFYQSVGRTDFAGSSFRALAESIHKKLFTLPDATKVFPGHMGPTEIGHEKENNPFVQVSNKRG